MTELPPLIEPHTLAEHLNSPYLRILDASWYMSSARRNAQKEYESERIPRARFFDIDAACDHTTPLPHMLPTMYEFASYAGQQLGISEKDTVVIYDKSHKGMFSAARCWWMFRVFSHQGSICLLNGGFNAWKEAGLPIESGKMLPYEPVHYAAGFRSEMVWDMEQIRHNLNTHTAQVVDARAKERFLHGPEPRPNLKSGHIPGSINLPFETLLDDKGRFFSTEKLKDIFAQAGVSLSRPVVTSCGSGVTASALNFALFLMNIPSALYDGSSAEYLDPAYDNPVESGG